MNTKNILKIKSIYPIVIGVNGVRRKNWVFAIIRTESGIEGIGEATLETYNSPVAEEIKYLGEVIIGEDLFGVESIWQRMQRCMFYRGGPISSSAIAAIDVAIWDILGQFYGVPIYKLLGGPCREKIKVYSNAWLSLDSDYSPESIINDAERPINKGFKALKFSIAHPAEKIRCKESLKKITLVIDALRNKYGNTIDIMFDAHGRLDRTAAVLIGKELEKFNILFYEEPVIPGLPEEMKWVSDKLNIPIAAGERLYSRYDVRPYLEKQAISVLQPDIAHCCGISEARKIANFAETYDISIAPHNPLSPVNTYSSLHLDASIPNFLIQEILFEEHDVVNDIFIRDSVCIKDGYIEIPKDPGLGIKINKKKIKKYPPIKSEYNGFYRDDKSLADW